MITLYVPSRPRQSSCPLPEHRKKSQGVGGKREGRVGSEGLWSEGRVLQLPWRGALQSGIGARPNFCLCLDLCRSPPKSKIVLFLLPKSQKSRQQAGLVASICVYPCLPNDLAAICCGRALTGSETSYRTPKRLEEPLRGWGQRSFSLMPEFHVCFCNFLLCPKLSSMDGQGAIVGKDFWSFPPTP